MNKARRYPANGNGSDYSSSLILERAHKEAQLYNKYLSYETFKIIFFLVPLFN